MNEQDCPICDRKFSSDEIEKHVNRCLFLNSVDETFVGTSRKRSKSSAFENKCNSPNILKKHDCTQKRCDCEDNINEYIKLEPIITIHEPKKFQAKTLQFHCGENEDSGKESTLHTLQLQPTQPNKKKRSIEYKSPKTIQNHDENKLCFTIPLAKQVQPKSLEQFFGQNKVLGKDTVLRQLLEKAKVPNMILWGPPGCGKTSLANVVHEICKTNYKHLKFVGLCAATCGVKEVQDVIAKAKSQLKYFNLKTILFMDEIHRFNKKQQDIFLLSVESGDITLIGATTENPSFSLNNALLSRCRVIVMDKLEPNCILDILKRAVVTLNINVVEKCDTVDIVERCIELNALQWIADTCDGDARIGLSNLQLLLQQNDLCNKMCITLEDIKDGIKKSHLLYDRRGEEHYNIISAMHKSIRGSDDNAALYWTTRMIVSGEDPRFIARRLIRAASEDIGNADPQALQLAIATMQGCELIGMPEADVLLAQCAIYLARAPKSREADRALAEAKRLITNCEGVQPSVPMHIRNAPTKLMETLGYAKVEEGTIPSFMPAGLENSNFFF